MEKELVDYFVAETHRAFGFVVTQYKFAPPRLEIDEKINFVFVIFMGKKIAIECILDEREADVDCKIALVIGGKKTNHYATDEAGSRVRESLASLLRRRGVKETLFSEVGKLELHKRIRVTLGDFALMLQKHGEEILKRLPGSVKITSKMRTTK